MQTDPLADFLTQIRNANQAGNQKVQSFYSRMKQNVANVLKEEGYIQDVEVSEGEGGKKTLQLKLKSDRRRRAITGIKRVSKPGLRKFVPAREIPRVLGGLGVAIISTSRGIMSGHEAKKQNVGGEVLAFIW